MFNERYATARELCDALDAAIDVDAPLDAVAPSFDGLCVDTLRALALRAAHADAPRALAYVLDTARINVDAIAPLLLRRAARSGSVRAFVVVATRRPAMVVELARVLVRDALERTDMLRRLVGDARILGALDAPTLDAVERALADAPRA